MLDFTICTVSLWSYINQPDVLPNYLNCLYDPNAKVIWPSVAPISLVSNQSKATQGIGILSGRMNWTYELFKVIPKFISEGNNYNLNMPFFIPFRFKWANKQIKFYFGIHNSFKLLLKVGARLPIS